MFLCFCFPFIPTRCKSPLSKGLNLHSVPVRFQRFETAAEKRLAFSSRMQS